jgi:hypothetical protein
MNVEIYSKFNGGRVLTMEGFGGRRRFIRSTLKTKAFHRRERGGMPEYAEKIKNGQPA